MKYCRINRIEGTGKARVAELFDFNPFEWIPNKQFLNDCVECNEETKNGDLMDLNNKTFEESEKLTEEYSDKYRLKNLEDKIIELENKINAITGKETITEVM